MYMHITLYKYVYSLLVIRLVPVPVHHHIHDISISDVSGRHKILLWWEGMRSEYESTRWLSVLEHWPDGTVTAIVIANDSNAGLEEEQMMWWSCVKSGI